MLADKNFRIYILEDKKDGTIVQLRYSINLDSDDVKFSGYVLGITMKSIYNEVGDLTKFYDKLGLNSPIENMNNTYVFKKNIYRATVKNNYLSIYITFSDLDSAESEYLKYNNIIVGDSSNDKKEETEADDVKYKHEVFFDKENIRFGMSEEELNDIKYLYKNYKDFYNADKKVVRYYYDENVHYPNLDEIQYWVYDNTGKLNSVMLKFKTSYYADYLKIKEVLTEKYGKPTKENLNFNDNTYKNDPAKALAYNYLTIKTEWKNQNGFDIVIDWSNSLATVTYCEKGYNGNY